MSVPFLKDGNFVPLGAPVAHGFFGRRGGASTGLYSSLNCGLGTQDNPDQVRENRARVTTALGADHLVSVRQVHSAICHFIDASWPGGSARERPEGDAMVTDVPGLGLGILTADCGPILFYGERQNGQPLIGAAHAGWSGALKGVPEATVRAMVDHGAVPDRIRASLGPCIGPRSYEVKSGFAEPFLTQDEANEHFFREARKDGNLMFDLPGYIANRLAQAGVRHVSITGVDTYADEDDYFSYRRTTHRAEKDYGRQISVVVIKKA